MHNQKSATQFIAKVISRLFGIVSLPGVILFLTFIAAGVDWQAQIPLVILYIIIGWAVPDTFFALWLKIGWVKDVDATDRHDRYLPFALFVGTATFLFVFSKWYLPTQFLYLYLSYCLSLWVVFLITFVYKVSVHALMTTSFYFILNQAFNWQFWWLFPLIIIVGWSRWIQKKHTIGQLLLGVLVVVFFWLVLICA